MDFVETFDNITEQSNLRVDLGFDSLDVMISISQIERRFRFRINEAELFNIVTVGDVLDVMEKKLAEQVPPPSAE